MKDIFPELVFVRNCYHSFLDKPYQQISFKSHLNSVLGKNIVRFYYVPCDFTSF